ncbi:MAG TPA: sugar ABC transporter permease [Anaerolineaceae bacterium]|mgnify:CR=1 FL=1|nr:sugar ABC transporter permease [Anaerolineaceae bacterium]
MKRISKYSQRQTVQEFLNRETTSAWFLMLPSFVIIFGLVGYPLIQAFVLSFHFHKVTMPNLGHPFVGFKNYLSVLSDPYFWSSFQRTALFMAISLVLIFIIGILVAHLLNKEFVGNKLLTTVVIIPWAIPITVNAMMWKWIFNPSYGSLNALLTQLGIISEYQAWLSTPTSAMGVLILCDVWKNFPLVAILTLAAMKTIPNSLYEAAVVDGANGWQIFWKITLPVIMPSLMVTLILRSVDAFKVFDTVYILTSGGPYDATKTIAYFGYLETFKYLDFGRGAAIAFIMTLFIGLLAFGYYRLLNHGNN